VRRLELGEACGPAVVSISSPMELFLTRRPSVRSMDFGKALLQRACCIGLFQSIHRNELHPVMLTGLHW
jgi:hypothetical protein